jgi:hypothetical protein
VRLDHLLSKERCPHACVWCQSPVCPRVWGSGCSRVEHRLFGTVLVSLTSTSRQLPVKRVLRPLRGSGSGTWGMVGAVSDTLLGPEGSGNTGWLSWPAALQRGWGWRCPWGRVSSGRGPCRWRSFAVSGAGCRLYFENFTVDASIFVAKFLRAHGGCLGTRNRRRT